MVVTLGFESEDGNTSSEDDYQSDDKVPLADLVPLAGLARNNVRPEEPEVEIERMNCWRKGRPPAANNFEFKGDHYLEGYKDLKEQIDFFRKFFDIEMTRLISKRTNLYSTQCDINKGAIGTSPNEIENYLRVPLHMCVVQMGVYKTWPTPFGLLYGLPLAHSWLSFGMHVAHSWPTCGPLLAYQPCISNTYGICTCHNNVVLIDFLCYSFARKV